MPVLAASSSPSDRTYSVAVGVILVFAALEILAIAIHFGAEYHAERATLPSLKSASRTGQCEAGDDTTSCAARGPQFGRSFCI